MRVHELDGNDVTALAETSAEIIARIRETGKPEFAHVKTYRVDGHTYFDPGTYRPDGEAEDMVAQNCPIARQRAALMATGCAEAELDRMRSEAQAEMTAALEAAKSAHWPADNTVFDDVQDVGSPALEAY